MILCFTVMSSIFFDSSVIHFCNICIMLVSTNPCCHISRDDRFILFEANEYIKKCHMK